MRLIGRREEGREEGREKREMAEMVVEEEN